jgi:hypothetical protein
MGYFFDSTKAPVHYGTSIGFELEALSRRVGGFWQTTLATALVTGIKARCTQNCLTGIPETLLSHMQLIPETSDVQLRWDFEDSVKIYLQKTDPAMSSHWATNFEAPVEWSNCSTGIKDLATRWVPRLRGILHYEMYACCPDANLCAESGTPILWEVPLPIKLKSHSYTSQNKVYGLDGHHYLKYNYGGTCRCPNGETYSVSALGPSCLHELACENGVRIDCSTGDQTHAFYGKKVVCAVGGNVVNFELALDKNFLLGRMYDESYANLELVGGDKLDSI